MTPLKRRAFLAALGSLVAAPALAEVPFGHRLRRGFFIPPGIVGIKQNHRLARKIRFCWVAQHPYFELSRGVKINDNNSTATPVLQPTDVGQAFFFGAATALSSNGIDFGYGLPTSDGGSGLGDYTLAAVANPAASANPGILLGSDSNSGTARRTNLLSNTDGSGNPSSGSMAFTQYDGTTVVVAALAGAVDGHWHSWMGTRAGSSATLYKDGASIATASHAAIDIGDGSSANQISIGNGLNTSLPQGLQDSANCGVAMGCAWDRGLTADEALEWGDDPSCMLEIVDEDLVGLIVGKHKPNYMPFFIPNPL